MCTGAQLNIILSAIYEKAIAEFGDKLDAVILYGSYARGDYDKESDIDVMVRVKLTQNELKSYERRLIHLASDLSLEHNITVSLNIQDAELFEQYKDDLPFYTNVMREGVRVSA